MYRRFCTALNDYGTLIPATDKVSQHGAKLDQGLNEYFTSIYKYNQKQYDEFQKTGSVAGVTDVLIDKLVFDFDGKNENGDPAPELAHEDTIDMCQRLMDSGFKKEDIAIYFSGASGFHIEVEITQDLTVSEFKAITKQMAAGLSHYDVKVTNPSRIFRVVGSVNFKTNLHKIPITFEELNESIQQIRERAKNIKDVDWDKFNWSRVSLPEKVSVLKKFKEAPKAKIHSVDTNDIDWSVKPKDFPSCRWAIYNGLFKPGERNEALMILTSYFKNKGETKETAYHRGLGTIELQAERNKCEELDKKEFYDTKVSVVYGQNWKGGQYSCRDEGSWLYDYCQALGSHKCDFKEEDDLKPVKLKDIQGTFKDYVINIEKNTIKTGLPSLDEKIFLSTGCNVGIIGAPGSGKTSIALDILSNTSKAGVHSVFASLDMHRNRLFEKALYRVSGKSRDELYSIFKENKEAELMEQLNHEFGNVNFFHKSSPTVTDIRNYVHSCEQATGEKIKLIMLDYFERVSTDVGDDTAASKKVAGELQDLVNDLDVCLVTLVQPHKAALGGGPDNPIMSYTNIKGSSYVYQAFRIIFSLWRPFYNPTDFSDDHYMQMAILKNDLGELSELTFGWQGKQGLITEIDDYQKQEFKTLLAQKNEKKNHKNDGWGK